MENIIPGSNTNLLVRAAACRSFSICFVGHSFNYACAVAGTAGVEWAIDLIVNEVSRDLGMLGAPSLADINCTIYA